MKKNISFILFLFPLFLSAQQYNVSLIPDSLIKSADAVKRFEEIRIIIKSIDKVVIKRKYAITVLREDGDKYAQYINDYDKLRDLSDISGQLFDASGNKLKSVKKKDIMDVSVQDGISLMGDDRIKAHNFYCKQYPYTVEYEDEQEYNGIFIFPSWQPVGYLYFSVQESKFIVETPDDYDLRFKQFNCPAQQPGIVKTSAITYTWQINNVKAFTGEIFYPRVNEIMPDVYIAPTHFVIGGYKGNMSTWKDLGKFQAQLNSGRDELPENVKQDVHRLTDNITDTKEKIKVLYNYLQNSTRYISVQLGIGGWQPFDAKYVASNKYGDCKALSNYMHSLLKEAGINGYYTLIKAGKNNKFYIPDFPSKQSNHVIVTVPLQKDTIWLECTNQYISAGYMSDFTDDRYALMIKEDGGYLIRTPKYGSDQNIVSRHVNATVDEKGNLSCGINTQYTGLEQEDIFDKVNYYSKEEQLKSLKAEIDIPTYDISSFHYEQHKGIVPSIDEQLQLVANNYAMVSGKRLFIIPNILSKNNTKLNATGERKYDIAYDKAFKHFDTTTITIPAGYTIEAMPKDVTISNKFGSYDVHFKVEGEKIIFTRVYTRTEGLFPPSDYNDLVKFYDAIYKADRSRIVFVKKEG